MASSAVKLITGVQWLFADHATDFGAAPADTDLSLIVGSPTDVQMDLTGLLQAGGARASAKADLGTPRATMYTVDACIEFATVPVEGETVDFYWSSSPAASANVGNAMSGSTTLIPGTDAGFTDTAGGLGQIQWIGSLTCQVLQVTQLGHVGVFSPVHRYGMMIVINRSLADDLASAGNMDDTHITMTEIIEDIQASA